MEYQLNRSQVAPDVVFPKCSSAVPRPRARANTPVVDVRPTAKGPTPADLGRLAAGDPVELVLDGRYRLERLIGHGGMGAVYLARNLRLGLRVAIKVLDIDEHAYRWAVAQFMREARLATRIRHRNIVEIHDFGTTPKGVVYIVMEYLEGRDLEAILRHHRLSWRWCRYTMQQICAGVEAIHGAGIVHRDLKASNCFYVKRNATIKILDFGIATTERRQLEDANGAVVGTPEYMAPEQVRGDPLDRRADVYSAGALLCKLLTGRAPFRGHTTEELFEHQLHTDPPPLRTLAEGLEIPGGLDELVACALAKDPGDRFSTMREFSDALDRIDQPSPLRRRID